MARKAGGSAKAGTAGFYPESELRMTVYQHGYAQFAAACYRPRIRSQPMAEEE